MGRVVIIAEKPDQGLTLASPFKFQKKNGYLEISPNDLFPDGAYCTWAVGHLTELSAPEFYHKEWKRWSLQTLPIIPERFHYEVTKSKFKQFKVVKDLLNRSDVSGIIHAGDAGREGELIVRNIVALSGVHKPMKRLWISSLTKKAIYEGFKNAMDASVKLNLFYEAYTRACADWLVGMNASRAYSILLKEKGIHDVFSVGRVQTPTLALIVKREREIECFKSEPFWEVVSLFDFDGKQFEGTWQQEATSRLKDPNLAQKIAAFCEGKPATIDQLKTERKVYQPPLLFNLSALQATANKAFQFSPKKTLDLAQALYQKGILSYPRSDSNYVTPGEAELFPGILNKLSQFKAYRDLVPAPAPDLKSNKRFVNEKKVSDHYAIIPTEEVVDPDRLPMDERKIYDLVVRRLIAAHHKPAIFDYTTITTLVDKRAEFLSKGRQMIEEGWRQVIFQENEQDVVPLPIVEDHAAGTVTEVRVKEGKTQAPKRYTEGQLITLMKTAGKFLENEDLEKVLNKVEGLGTEATRAGIITMLKTRNYIHVTKNQVYATDKGKVLIEAIGEVVLASPELTAKWEERLAQIGEGKAEAAQFMEQTKKLVMKVVQEAQENASDWTFDGLNLETIQRMDSKWTIGKKVGTCRLCGGDVLDKGKFYGCSNYKKQKCPFTLSKMILGKKLTASQVKQLLENGQTSLIKGFKSKNKTFDAQLQMVNGNVQFFFGSPKIDKKKPVSSSQEVTGH